MTPSVILCERRIQCLPAPRTESHEVEVTERDEDGKETTRTETVTETILEIFITHKTPEEMAQQCNFNARQNEYLALMSEPEKQNLWAELLGGFVGGGGEIIDPDTDWEGTGIFQWPLPQSYSMTSCFGYCEDPLLAKSPVIVALSLILCKDQIGV